MATVDELIRQLKRGYRNEREEAANALGDIGDPKAVPALLEAMEDADERVWFAAVRAVGKIGDLNAIPKLIDKYRKARFYRDIPLMKQIVESVGEILGRTSPDDNKSRRFFSRAVNWLIEVVRDEGYGLRMYGVYGSRQLYEAFLQTRAFATEALGKTRDPKAIPVLTELVHERNTPAEVKKAAVHALSNFNTPKVIRTLINVATGKTDASGEVRKVAINSLGKIGGSQAVRVLIQILEDSSDEYTVRIEAASALGHTGDPNAIEPLIGALERHKDSYAGIAIAAARALGNFRDPKVIDALIAALGFGYDYSISREAAKSLKELRDKRAVEPLLRILDDEGERCSSEREFAVQLLGVLGDPRAVPAIVKALRANDYHVSKAAFESIQPFIPTHPDAILRLPPEDRNLLGRLMQDAERDEFTKRVCGSSR